MYSITCIQICKLREQSQKGHHALPLAEEGLRILAANHQHSCFYPTNPTASGESPVCQEDSPVKYISRIDKWNRNEMMALIKHNLHTVHAHVHVYMHLLFFFSFTNPWYIQYTHTLLMFVPTVSVTMYNKYIIFTLKFRLALQGLFHGRAYMYLRVTLFKKWSIVLYER